MTDLSVLLDDNRINCGCEIRSKKRALQSIAELLGASLRGRQADAAAATEHPAPKTGKKVKDEPVVSDMDILDALITRERLGSTGIGHGIALPHARLAMVEEPLAALITLKEGVDFESIDGELVDVVVGLLVPQDCNDEHLKILAELARRFSDADLRDTLRNCEDGSALMSRLGTAASG